MPTLLDRPTRITDAEWAAMVDELTRRGFLGGGLGSAALLGLAACGSPSSAGSRPASPATRLVDSVNGKVRVPASPSRVVSAYTDVVDTLFDLGVSPVAIFDEGAQYVSPRYGKRWNATPKVNSAGSAIDIEKVAAARPDLIIGSDVEFNTSIYSQLTDIAPTVITPLTPWQSLARVTADAMNKMAALEQLEKQLTQRSAQIKSGYAGVLSRFHWDILQGGFTAGEFSVYGPNSLAGLVLGGAGVRFASASTSAAASKTPGLGISTVSYENIGQLSDAGVIGYYATYADKPNNLGPQLFAQTLWKDLPAVKAGRLVPIPDFLVGGYGDALAMLDELEAGLRKLS